MRCGILLALLFLVYAWCRWGLALKGFSPIIQLGTTSLLVYWVHIEFVYGRFSILPKGRCSILKATAGLLIIFLAMVALSVLRTRWKKRPAKVLQAVSRPAGILPAIRRCFLPACRATYPPPATSSLRGGRLFSPQPLPPPPPVSL